MFEMAQRNIWRDPISVRDEPVAIKIIRTLYSRSYMHSELQHIADYLFMQGEDLVFDDETATAFEINGILAHLALSAIPFEFFFDVMVTSQSDPDKDEFSAFVVATRRVIEEVFKTLFSKEINRARAEIGPDVRVVLNAEAMMQKAIALGVEGFQKMVLELMGRLSREGVVHGPIYTERLEREPSSGIAAKSFRQESAWFLLGSHYPESGAHRIIREAKVIKSPQTVPPSKKSTDQKGNPDAKLAPVFGLGIWLVSQMLGVDAGAIHESPLQVLTAAQGNVSIALWGGFLVDAGIILCGWLKYLKSTSARRRCRGN